MIDTCQWNPTKTASSAYLVDENGRRKISAQVMNRAIPLSILTLTFQVYLSSRLSWVFQGDPISYWCVACVGCVASGCPVCPRCPRPAETDPLMNGVFVAYSSLHWLVVSWKQLSCVQSSGYMCTIGPDHYGESETANKWRCWTWSDLYQALAMGWKHVVRGRLDLGEDLRSARPCVQEAKG